MRHWMMAMLAVAALCACDGKKDDERAEAPRTPEEIKIAQASVAVRPMYNEETPKNQPLAYQWQGRWDGPEGTFLVVSYDNIAGYTVTIADLDGPQVFGAKPVDKGLAFRRNGVVETIRAGDGDDTGMKWLADKKDCLVVKQGEGFCR